MKNVTDGLHKRSTKRIYMKKLKIGLAGTGFISKFHYDGFLKNENAAIVGMCTHSNQEKLHRMCGEWGIKPYGSYTEMVEDPDIDALVIGSVNTEHYNQIMKAIELGKPVLAEKPVVTDFRQLDEIIRYVKEKKVPVMPAHNFVYRKAIQDAKNILDSGKLGTVTYASFMSTHTLSDDHSTGWRGKKELSFGGALMDSGHHQVYMSLYFMGMPKKLQAFKSNLVLSGMEGEDIAQVNVTYAHNTLGCIMQSWTSNFGDGINGIKIMGNKGQILITDALYFIGNKLSDDVDYARSFVHQANAFTDYVFNGIEPISTLEDVRNTLRIIFSAYESSEKGIVVTF
jgi:predicted dehydrogenase